MAVITRDHEEHFREAMKALREAQNLTQTELARTLKGAGLAFHQSTVAKIETGERPVRLDEAYAIAAALSASVDWMTSARPGEAVDNWHVNQEMGRARDARDSVVAAIHEMFESWASFNLAVSMLKRRTGETEQTIFLEAALEDFWLDRVIQEGIAKIEVGEAEADAYEKFMPRGTSMDDVWERIQALRRRQSEFTEADPDAQP